MINLNKDKFTAIEGAFKMLIEHPESHSPVDVIKENLEKQFNGLNFDIHVVMNIDMNVFIMSVFPDKSDLDKIVSAIMSNRADKAVEDIWKKTKNWTIEIDSTILTNMVFNEKELTALLLHEIGHIVYSNSIPYRLSTILKYEIIRSRYSDKAMLKDRIFRMILSIPILDACVSDKKSSSIKDEVKADSFVKKMGYSQDLISALNKLEKIHVTRNHSTANDSMKKLGEFSLQTLRDIKERKDKLVKSNLTSLIEGCYSPYMKGVIETIYETYCVDGETRDEGSKFNFLCERADELEKEAVFNEFFLLGKKDLKRIDPADLDYIAVQSQNIKYEGDKTMMLTYIHSKLDIIDYYIQILENKRYRRKYNVPHSLEQLQDMRRLLLKYRENILKYKIPEIGKIVISWPEGYEG